VLTLDGGTEITGDELLALVPDYHLDEISERLFGSARPASFTLPFPACDRKLLAIEYHEFGRCVLTGTAAEVDGLIGRQALAICYAGLESAVLNRPVSVDDVEQERTAIYEADINAYWKI